MDTTKKTEPIELYQQALKDLDEACSGIDQAHSTLKDLSLDWYGPRGMSIRKLHDEAERLFKALQEIQCDECGKPIKENCECWRPGWKPEEEQGR